MASSLNEAECSLNEAECSLNEAECSLNEADGSLNEAECPDWLAIVWLLLYLTSLFYFGIKTCTSVHWFPRRSRKPLE
jgi:hypothetical protein